LCTFLKVQFFFRKRRKIKSEESVLGQQQVQVPDVTPDMAPDVAPNVAQCEDAEQVIGI
jgi:hypothetical protein